MKKLIEVTAAVIEKATLADSSHCMIADAVRAALPYASHVSVDLQTIRYTDRAEGKRLIYLTPLLAQQQLLRFDQGAPIEPWSFRLPTTAAQVVPIRARPENTNKAGRPTSAAPRSLKSRAGRTSIPTVIGGKAPPTAVLSHSPGRQRVFGIRAARGFNPAAAGTAREVSE